MRITPNRAYVPELIKKKFGTLNRGAYGVDRTQTINQISFGIYNKESELIYHCKDIINMLAPKGTSKRIKEMYLKYALQMAEHLKYEGCCDIGLINKYIQGEIDKTTSSIKSLNEDYSFSISE